VWWRYVYLPVVIRTVYHQFFVMYVCTYLYQAKKCSIPGGLYPRTRSLWPVFELVAYKNNLAAPLSPLLGARIFPNTQKRDVQTASYGIRASVKI
jgi:hypothetical protein